MVLEWDDIEHATADIISLSLFRNNQKAGNIPRPKEMHSTKISGLAVDKEFTFHLTLRTTAGTYSSEKVTVKTHKMTDLSGITVTPGILPAQLRESLVRAVERIGGKIADSVRIDTTHFVTTEGRGISWEKAVEMNVPVVRPEWMDGCEAAGKIVGVRQYYLDADPRQRQVVHTQAPAQQQQPEQPLPSPQPQQQQKQGSTQSLAASSPPPPAPPAKDEPKGKGKAEEESSDDDEEESHKGEPGQQAAVDEQKVRVEDVDLHRVALRPTETAPEPENEAESEDDEDEDEKDDEKDEKAEESGHGTLTPGNASFQDVAL